MKKRLDWYGISLVYSRVTKGDKMKSKQLKNGLWKNKVVFFNGFQAKAVDLKLKDLGLKFKLQFLNGKTKWVDFNLIVWD